MQQWLIFFGSVALAMVLSHICSLLEAAILSITPSQIADLRLSSRKAGALAQNLKKDIDKPIAVILIINTAAHTIGAAVAGASLNELFHGKYMGVFSLLFTLLMVQYTEILPKTLGVRFNRRILAIAAPTLHILVVLLNPLIKLTHFINKPFERKEESRPSTTEEISALNNKLIKLRTKVELCDDVQKRVQKIDSNLSELDSLVELEKETKDKRKIKSKTRKE